MPTKKRPARKRTKKPAAAAPTVVEEIEAELRNINRGWTALVEIGVRETDRFRTLVKEK